MLNMSIALHEAGHAIMAHALNLPVKETRAAADTQEIHHSDGDISAGYCWIVHPPGNTPTFRAFALAGGTAQAIAGDGRAEHTMTLDSRDVLSAGATAAEIDESAAVARNALVQNWPAVEELAAALHTKGIVSGEESKAIYDKHRMRRTINDCIGTKALRDRPARREGNWKVIEPTGLSALPFP